VRAACRLVGWLFLAAYAAAAGLGAIGYFGLLGAQKDALSVVYLMLLGMPWIRLADAVPEPLALAALALAPLVNWLILRAICARLGRREGLG
jgi:hypothetical protein